MFALTHKFFAPIRRAIAPVMLCLVLATPALAAGSEAATPLPPRPDYVTAWPKQVPVEKPDPVLGDKPYLEIWSYSKEFGKRFKGFPIEGADTPTVRPGPAGQALRWRAWVPAIESESTALSREVENGMHTFQGRSAR